VAASGDPEETIGGGASVASTVRHKKGAGPANQLPPEEEDRPRVPAGKRRAKAAAAKDNRLWIALTIGGGVMAVIAVVLVVIVMMRGTTSTAPAPAAMKSAPRPVKQPPKEQEVEQAPQAVQVEQPRSQVRTIVVDPVWRTQSANKLGQIAKAMHLFHDDFKAFPYAKNGGPGKKGALSWRVAILPYVEQQNLYKRFKLDEPWDSSHNKRILDEEAMPSVFASPAGNPGEENKTYYQIITGPNTAWPDDNARPRLPGSFPNGTSTTYLIVEAKTPVYWTQPEDVVFDGSTVPPLGGIFNGDFHAAMADGSVQYVIRGDVNDEQIRRAISASGN
jgi:hypothetical protein